MNYWKDKIILITGASSGIGAEFARQMSVEAKKIILLARREEKLIEIKDELKCEAEVLICDLNLKEQKGEFLGVNQVREFIESNKIDILINNAGLGSFGYFDEIEKDQEESIINVNVMASTLIAQSIIKQMRKRRCGAIISVASVASFQPIPLMATYSASKAFNFIQGQALRSELKSFNVRVINLCPGPVDTEFGGVARVPGTVTGGGRTSKVKVVKDALDGLNKNKAFVVPGISAKFLAIFSRYLPEYITSKIVLFMLMPTYKKSRELND